MFLKKSTIQLLRIPFSFFLMPVFWLALSQTPEIDSSRAFLIFIILHLLLYPASNGYNSYMDRDKGPIGGLEEPGTPTRQLYFITIALDLVALLISAFITPLFFAGMTLYVAASRAYSFRGIRLKRYPVIGYLTVVICQGALTFFLVMHGSSTIYMRDVPLLGMVAASLLVGGFYPLTQIYQHLADKEDGVTTISYILGYRGTFIFTILVYSAAMLVLALYFFNKNEFDLFLRLQLFLLPVLVYFFWWMNRVFRDQREANFKRTMWMNLIGATCTNAAFIYLFLNRAF